MTIPLASRNQNDSSTVIADSTVVVTDNSSPVNQGGSTTNINQATITSPVLTGASNQTAGGDNSIAVPADEHWVNSHWRPVAGWVYLLICLTDFLIFPVLWSLVQAKFGGQITAMWQPLTLQGGGLFHIAFGTLLGITSYGRTREKLAGVN